MTSIKLTTRAKEKGITEFNVIAMKENEDIIACVVHQKIMKNGIVTELLEPTIVFKNSEIKSKNYDQGQRLAESVGYLELLPELINFTTDYYGLDINGYTNMIKSWGYNSNHLPKRKRWDYDTIVKKANEWVENIYLEGVIIMNMINIYNNNYGQDVKEKKAKEWFSSNGFNLEY